jgi:diguanylate cyclase (GGDEF)-like protein
MLSMTPFVKRNLLIPVSFVFYAGLLYSLINFVPVLRSSIQHLEFLAISLMIMMSLAVMLFWATLGVFGGLACFLVTMMFIYRPLTDLNPYYYSVLILAFFLSSFIGHYIYRKINTSNQDYTVTMEKVEEDTNLIRNHLKNRTAEVSAMEDKVKDLLDIKGIADGLSLSLSTEEVSKLLVEKTFEIFRGATRVLLYMVDAEHNELNLSNSAKSGSRHPATMKKGEIYDRWVMKNIKSLLIKDIKKDFRFSVDEEGVEHDFTSLISKPLVSEGNVLGILRVDSPTESAFSQYELRILDIIGEMGAVALENSRLYRQTEELAIKDGLTGLFVHRYFMERLEEEIKRTLHSGGSFALLMLDIDNFKDFNDKYGHISGDVILKNISRVLKSEASAGDIVGRYGGEEFAFVELNCSKKEAIKLAEDIRKKIKKSSITIRRKKMSVTVSVGVAMFPDDAKLMKDLIWEADKRLYQAKSKGKDTVCSE